MAALGAHQQAHRHASHRTGHHNGNRRTTMRRQHADIEHVARSGEHARDGHRQDMRVHPSHASAHALPHPGDRSPPCKPACAENKWRQDVSPVTCAPAGGQHAAQCMAACPPPPRGAVRVRGGGVPRPSHHLPPGTSNCRTDVPLIVQHLNLRLLALNTSPAVRYDRGSIQHRQPEMKMLGRERYIELRKRGQRGCRPFVASP